MRKLSPIALLSLACVGAQADQAEAVNAALADTVTTAVSLAAGMVELNPLGGKRQAVKGETSLSGLASAHDAAWPAAGLIMPA